MKHNANRDTAKVSEIFFEGSPALVRVFACRVRSAWLISTWQNGSRIFYLVIAHSPVIEWEVLVFHIFRCLRDITDAFDLIIDLTGFSSSTEIPMVWIRKVLQMSPPGILSCLRVSVCYMYRADAGQTLALYNPNSYFRRGIRRIVADLAPHSVSSSLTALRNKC